MTSKQPWLLIDCPNLLHRAWHTTGKLEYGDQPTGTIFGFLKQVKSLQSRFQTEQVAFAFDSGKSLRARVCKTYKANRKRKPRNCADCPFDVDGRLLEQCNRCIGADRQDAEAYEAFKKQCLALRTEHLPALGHRNVFTAEGYEADDIIACIARYSLREHDEAVIVSSDHDLFQLLSNRSVQVSQWLPHKKVLFRGVDFVDEWGIHPDYWPSVLALAGCPGDGVEGIQGVGLKTAAKYFSGRLKTGKVLKRIEWEKPEVFPRNLPLVWLPYKYCPVFKLRKDDCTPGRWRKVCRELGFDSLLNV